MEVYVGRTGCSLCPIAAVSAYMISRGDRQGPFFIFRNNQPLTKPKFVKLVREALQTAELPYQSFAGHSFRIGAATAAAKAGIEDSTIQMMGRWSSAAFLAYIRMPKEQLAHFSGLLAKT